VNFYRDHAGFAPEVTNIRFFGRLIGSKDFFKPAWPHIDGENMYRRISSEKIFSPKKPSNFSV